MMLQHELLQAIKERRSIRRFQEKAVEPEKLQELFEAVRWAPSWGNSQCWEIVVIEDQADKDGLVDLLTPKNPATRAISQAPVVLGICGQKHKAGYYNGERKTKFEDWLMYDLGLTTQNLCLAAHVLGLGSVIVGSFDHDRVAELLEIPDSYDIVALIPIGYPAHAPSPPPRRPVAEFVHYRRF
jgi:nitroreductase